MKKKFICFVAGKSGGHLLPCLTTAKKIVEQHPTTEILFFTTKTTLDQELLQHYPFIQEHYTLSCSSLPHKNIIIYFRFITTFIYSFFQSFWILFNKKPEKIISMGGAVSLPVCAAGALLNIPIELIELNAIPGKTIKALAPLATTISLCFKETQKYFSQKCFITNYPLRFSKIDSLSLASARSQLGLNPNKKTLFILGGSQGSLFINNCVKKWIENNHTALLNVQIIHQTGLNDATDWKIFYNNYNISHFTFSFYHHINYCYSAADLIICRSGAGTLFEVTFFNKPCITIPLEIKQTMHQYDNATAFMQRTQQITVIRQKDIENSFNIFNTVVTKKLCL